MKEIATIILNRNLPNVVNKLVENLKKNDGDISDFYVVEAGSDINKISKYTSWHVREKNVLKNGLRFPRGMNYGLHRLYKEKKFNQYKAFLLLTNDTQIKNKRFIKPLYEEMIKHPQLGILSPCGKDWGEINYLKKFKTKYFYYVHNHAYLINKDFIKRIINYKPNSYKNFLFDGNNFRGYGTEMEFIAKCYLNDYAAGITSIVIIEENEILLKKFFKTIKTDNYKINEELYISEGKRWMREKYGFSSKWAMIYYAKNFYEKFFENYPNLIKYKL